jgi:hypothetical protein
VVIKIKCIWYRHSVVIQALYTIPMHFIKCLSIFGEVWNEQILNISFLHFVGIVTPRYSMECQKEI